jgi:ribonuclease D
MYSAETPRRPREIVVGDLSEPTFREFHRASQIAVDIETSGLDWHVEAIGVVQLFAARIGTVIVRPAGEIPRRVVELIDEPTIEKVFHHAPFDLRFMVARWGARPANIRCTKVASKLLAPHLAAEEHSLKPLLRRTLGVEVDKASQVSDWLAEGLSQEQLNYAATDVAYLLSLWAVLERDALEHGLDELVRHCFAHIPTRVNLEVAGYGDVFAY